MTAAYHSIKQTKDIPLFIFGDHASRHIPDEFNDLGLTGDDLTRHIAWDIGTETIVRELCADYGCAGQVAGVSRLVVDLNRDLTMGGLIPVKSDGTLIPGNLGLNDKARKDRLDRFYHPYHNAISETLDTLEDPLVISIHSFTPKPETGTFRMLDIGLLVKHDEDSAKQLRQRFMQLGRNFSIGINEPYSAYDLNHTIDVNVASRGLRHLAIEIRQDHIDTEEKARDIAKVLAGCLAPLVNRQQVRVI